MIGIIGRDHRRLTQPSALLLRYYGSLQTCQLLSVYADISPGNPSLSCPS